DFNASYPINEIDFFTLQDNYQNPSPPTLNMTFTLYGVTDFEVQYWTGSTWTDVPGGNVTGNNHVWTQFTFASITTAKIRVLINNSYFSGSNAGKRKLRSEEHTSELQSRGHLVCRLLLEKK